LRCVCGGRLGPLSPTRGGSSRTPQLIISPDLGRGGREQREPAAVEVDDDRERRRRGRGGGEHARPQPARRVDVDVAGAHAGPVRARRGAGLAVGQREREAVHRAVAPLRDVGGKHEPEHSWSRTVHGSAGAGAVVSCVVVSVASISLFSQVRGSSVGGARD
jgi:hypothetical protein